MTNNVLAIILGQEDWREHDAVITMYSRERGKIETLARGLRKAESKLASHLEPLMTAEIFLAEGRRWPIVAGSIVEQGRLNLRDDFDRLILAGTIVRLVDLMTPMESRDDGIYNVLDETLSIISENHLRHDTAELLTHLFAWKLLVFSGYRPELKYCFRCKQSSIVGKAHLDVRRGSIVHEACLVGSGESAIAPLGKAAIKGLVYMATASIGDALRLRGTDQSFEEIKRAISLLVEEKYEQPVRFVNNL